MTTKKKIRVIVEGQETEVIPQPEWNIAAVTTHARWQTGYGHYAADRWEVRDEQGALLDQAAMPGNVALLCVNPPAGIGG